MKKILGIFIFIVFFAGYAQATHNRAGEITYEQIGPLTFRVTITTYTFYGTGIYADRPELEIQWGDGSTAILPRVVEEFLPDNYKHNVYIGTHTYSGAGTYELVMQDPNRNEGIDNIPNSVNVLFTLSTTLQINPQLGSNSTPVLLNPPTDKAAVNQIFIHNPNAWDPDGDSLSYKLAICLGDNVEPIEGYTFPPSTNTPVYVDEITGDLVWDSPPVVGKYNVAMAIEEWRNGVKIGEIIRDMQIDVEDTDNNPPIIFPVDDICVEAGEEVEFEIKAYDPDGDPLTLTATGGPFQVEENPAVFAVSHGNDTVTSTFRWETNCTHVRQQPYTVIFKARDDNPELSLSSYLSVNIRVVANAPEFTSIMATNNSIFLEWTESPCPTAVGYKLYRKDAASDWQHDSCEVGVPAYTGFRHIATIEGLDNRDFLDNDNGTGLQAGFWYCYIVTAYFEDGGESYASEIVCEDLLRANPLYTMATVNETGTNNGIIDLEWTKPQELDTIENPGPYRYSIFPSLDLWCEVRDDPFYKDALWDTTLTVNQLNTEEEYHSFLLALYSYNDTTDRYDILTGTPQCASSVFLDIYPTDNKLELFFKKNVPWQNFEYEVYRMIEDEWTFIGATDSIVYIDEGLVNGEEYCYLVKSRGEYTIDNIKYPIENWSQIACGVPIDTIPPCQPTLSISSACDEGYNKLVWTNPNNYCSDDALYYNIYYTNLLDQPFGEPLHTTESAEDTVFLHYPEQHDFPTMTLAGCYAVTAVDSFMNESPVVQRRCIDNCEYYRLPNVFSPDNDGINDLFMPYPYQFVEKVDMKIYNRWGELIYQTNDPDINWDGKHQDTDEVVSDGVYYYLCDVYEYRLSGLEERNINGFIHVFTGDGQQP